MILTRHAATAAVALLITFGCGRPDDVASGGARAPVGASASPPASAAPPDGAPPNRVLDAARFADPKTRAAYAAAKQYAHVLEGIYCHCHCRENIGHRALVECFETDHATDCDICQTEAMVAARMAAEGRSVDEIQQAIDVYYKG
jgi:hypothetical protein